MTTHYKTQGFVFAKSNLNESDRSFAVFTKDYGRLEVRGKAIRKIVSKLMPDIDIFYLSELEFIQGKTAKTLTDAQALERFKQIPQSPEKFKIASSISKVLDDFLKGQEPDEKIFSLIKEIFSKLNDLESYKLKAISYKLVCYFLWNFLTILGYGPEVQKCVICQEKLNPYAIYFSHKLGGTVCGDCVDMKKAKGPEPCRRINSDIVKILRLILKSDWQTLSKLKISQESQNLFATISNNYYLYHLPQKI